MKVLAKRVKDLLKKEDGMELTEYALVGGIIVLIAVAVFVTWGKTLNNIFSLIVSLLQTA